MGGTEKGKGAPRILPWWSLPSTLQRDLILSREDQMTKDNPFSLLNCTCLDMGGPPLAGIIPTHPTNSENQ